MITKETKGKYTEIYATEGYLHKTGDKTCQKIRRALLASPDDASLYEEIPFGEYGARVLEQYKKEEYSRRLSAAVHERYSLDDEIALAANVSSASLLDDEEAAEAIAGEYAEYQRYRAECKERVRAEIEAITELPEEEP